MKKILVFDCASGISGDMLVGALLDLGVPFNYLSEQLKKLQLNDYEISYERVKRLGCSGIKFNVICNKSHYHRHYSDIKNIIVESALNKFVKKLSLKIFYELALAESIIHGVDIEKIHFHEVGAMDSIIDIVAIAICFDYLQIEKYFVNNLTCGSGVLQTSGHGNMPIPSLATTKLLAGYTINFSNIKKELITPTGAAVIKALAVEEKPTFRIDKTGFGAGARDLSEQPNLLRIFYGEKTNLIEENIWQADVNIDDMPPIFFEYLFDKLFQCGAKDVFVCSILMKKQRLAWQMSVLYDKSMENEIINIVLRNTSSIGLRKYKVERYVLRRENIELKTKYGIIKAKKSYFPEGDARIYPEYGSCRKMAEKLNMSLLEIYNQAMAICNNLQGRHDGLY